MTSQLPLLVAGSMPGHWDGTRTRLQAYLGGLLREVAPERETIVELAYDAAQTRSATGDHRNSTSERSVRTAHGIGTVGRSNTDAGFG